MLRPKDPWRLIPTTTNEADRGSKPVDILVTHEPPQGHRGVVIVSGRDMGCAALRKVVYQVRECSLLDSFMQPSSLKIKPLIHIFGHVHEGTVQQHHTHSQQHAHLYCY